MANSKFYLKNKKSKNKTIVRLYFNYNGNVLKYSTKISIKPSNWNSNTCRVKQQATLSLELNKQIQKIENAIMEIYQNMITNDRMINNKILEEH